MSQRMQIESRRRDEGPELENSDWCVGDASGRWDVSFTERLWWTLRRWFGGAEAAVGPQQSADAVPMSRSSAEPDRKAA